MVTGPLPFGGGVQADRQPLHGAHGPDGLGEVQEHDSDGGEEVLV